MSKYCSFCQEESTTGDCNKTIIESQLKLNGQLFVSQEVFVENEDLVLFVNSYDAGICYEFKRKKIKYCPMCGRKLRIS